MITAVEWQYDGNKAPWIPFDAEAGLNFSFDFADWVASSGSNLTLASATIIAPAGLTVGAPVVAGTVVTTRIAKADPSVEADVGTFIGFTVRPVLSDGQHDRRTFYLLIAHR